ncbi:MAG: hypothetical protein DHS80DRAFT_25235 [Piptocephalis tieghemiana]|nr:MAG: hypothetical protein DHS80DRAFT_25235 [Piptocephalis tieghemiana]
MRPPGSTRPFCYPSSLPSSSSSSFTRPAWARQHPPFSFGLFTLLSLTLLLFLLLAHPQVVTAHPTSIVVPHPGTFFPSVSHDPSRGLYRRAGSGGLPTDPGASVGQGNGAIAPISHVGSPGGGGTESPAGVDPPVSPPPAPSPAPAPTPTPSPSPSPVDVPPVSSLPLPPPSNISPPPILPPASPLTPPPITPPANPLSPKESKAPEADNSSDLLHPSSRKRSSHVDNSLLITGAVLAGLILVCGIGIYLFRRFTVAPSPHTKSMRYSDEYIAPIRTPHTDAIFAREVLRSNG